MINICARRAKTATGAAYQRNGKSILLQKVVFLRFCGRLFPTLTFQY